MDARVSRTLVIIPIRGSHGAKTRLASMFSAEERAQLVWHMAATVLTAIDDAGVVDHVLIVTHEPDAVLRHIGHASHRTVIAQPRADTGLNTAVGIGRDWAIAHWYQRMLVVSADLPTLAAADVRTLVGRSDPVVIAPDRHGTGTNALLLRLEASDHETAIAGGPFTFGFGETSYNHHAEEARRLGLEAATIIAEGLQLDLDTPDDWSRLPPMTRDRMLIVVGHAADEPLTGRQVTCSKT